VEFIFGMVALLFFQSFITLSAARKSKMEATFFIWFMVIIFSERALYYYRFVSFN
jgi:hypothetical protein